MGIIKIKVVLFSLGRFDSHNMQLLKIIECSIRIKCRVLEQIVLSLFKALRLRFPYPWDCGTPYSSTYPSHLFLYLCHYILFHASTFSTMFKVIGRKGLQNIKTRNNKIYYRISTCFFFEIFHYFLLKMTKLEARKQ